MRLVRDAECGTKSKHNSPVQPLNDKDDEYIRNLSTITTKTTTPVKYNRSQYRKLVLREPHQQGHQQGNDKDESDFSVFQDPAIQLLLSDDNDDDMRCYKATHSWTFQYPQDYDMDTIFKHLFPFCGEIPGSSFEVAGTIAHVNLRRAFLPFKYWIGKVLYDKLYPRIQTVVTKVGTIETVYRTFDMEVIAPCCDEHATAAAVDDGTASPNATIPTIITTPRPQKDWNIVTVKEEGCSFQLDYLKVYWNSRLSREHERIVTLLQQENRVRQQDGETQPMVVVDLMAGVGPFAIPLTTTNKHTHRTTPRNNSNDNQFSSSSIPLPMIVHANDLNPSCYHYLQINARQNKCSDQLHLYNMDGRVLVHQLQDANVEVDHFLMNLPAMAPECCNAFCGYRPPRIKQHMPMVHVHCFAPKPSNDSSTNNDGNDDDDDEQPQVHPYQVAVDRCSRALQFELDEQRDEVVVHVVRDVSPNKFMLCVSFRLPMAVQHVPRAVFNVEQANTDKASAPAASICSQDAEMDNRNEPLAVADDMVPHDAKRLKLMI
jgi:tRNA (guanine37-N1)-methyltransferase